MRKYKSPCIFKECKSKIITYAKILKMLNVSIEFDWTDIIVASQHIRYKIDGKLTKKEKIERIPYTLHKRVLKEINILKREYDMYLPIEFNAGKHFTFPE